MMDKLLQKSVIKTSSTTFSLLYKIFLTAFFIIQFEKQFGHFLQPFVINPFLTVIIEKLT